MGHSQGTAAATAVKSAIDRSARNVISTVVEVCWACVIVVFEDVEVMDVFGGRRFGEQTGRR